MMMRRKSHNVVPIFYKKSNNRVLMSLRMGLDLCGLYGEDTKKIIWLSWWTYISSTSNPLERYVYFVRNEQASE